MSKHEDDIRSFGMSGYLITEEIRALERRFSLELGHSSASQATEDEWYYSQFEQKVRTEAEEMSKRYKMFYCLEQTIRRLIGDNLRDAAGSDWWNSERVPDAVKRGTADRIKRDIDSGMTRRSDLQIDYTNFGELSVLIVSNWDVFGSIFSSQRAVERVLNNLSLLRGPIAHCCPISDDEVQRLELSVKDWFRMIA